MRAIVLAGAVPDGRWRVGTRCLQQLHIDAPDGATIDVGRVDSPTLAAYVVEAVNDRDHIEAVNERDRMCAAFEEIVAVVEDADPAATAPDLARIARIARRALGGQ